MMKNKKFDCIQMKDEAQRQRAEALRGLSPQERREFHRRAHEDLVRRKAGLLAKCDREIDDEGPRTG